MAYGVGSADDGDIVLRDATIAPHHLTLRVQAGQWQLAAVEGAVAIGQRSLAPGEALDLPLEPVILRLGDLLVGLGTATTDWSRLPVPAESAAGPGAVVTPAATAPPPTTPDDTAVDVAPVVPTPAIASPVPMETDPAPVARRRARESFAQFRSLALAVVAVLVLLLPLLWWQPVQPPPTASVPPVTAARQLLADWKLDGIEVKAAADGGVILTGYCANADLKDRLSAALRARGVVADNRLWPEDWVREALAETLRRLAGQSLGFTYLGQGVVRLDGYLPPKLSRNDLFFTIRNDVPGIVRVDSAFKTLDDYLTELRGQVGQAGLAGLVTVTADGPGLCASGTLDAAPGTRWKALAQAFQVATPGGPALDDRVTQRAVADPPPPAVAPVAPRVGVQGVIIGADQSARALLSDGTMVAVGDPIDSRYLVEQIQFNEVVLNDGLQRQVLRLGTSAK